MKQSDINKRYRTCVIYYVVRGRKNNGKGHITWDELCDKFGVGWESLMNELKVKGILYGSTGFIYLTPTWANMTNAEQMEEIIKIYPYKR